MTKTLTEQWREGTLPDGHYYVQYDNWAPFIKDLYGMSDLKKCIDSEKIKVLLPVPSYDEIKRLQEQLKIATKALKEIRKGIEDFNDDPMNKIGFMAYGTLHECLKKSKQALKEMEGVK